MMLHVMVTDIKEPSTDSEPFATPENEGEMFMNHSYYYISLLCILILLDVYITNFFINRLFLKIIRFCITRAFPIENENDVASVLPIDEKISLTEVMTEIRALKSEVMTEIRALKSEVQELRSQFQDFIKHQQNTPTVCVRVEGATVQSSFVNTAASISDKSTQ